MKAEGLELDRLRAALTKAPQTAAQIALRAFPEDIMGGFLADKVHAQLLQLVAKGEASLVGQEQFRLPE
jgi:DUF917 family protein